MAYERQYYTNGDVLDARQMNHMETGIKENSDNIDKLSEDIATKASAIKEKASGEVIVVTDSDEQKPLGLAIDGKSEQNQYSGKNLLKNTATTKTNNGVTFTVNDDGSITINGTATGTADFYIAGSWGSTENILSAEQGKVRISGTKTNTVHVYVVKNQNTLLSITTGDDAEFDLSEGGINALLIRVSRGVTVSNYTFYPMIRLSTITDDTYEPYCGGIPSPNPSYPQEIRNIGVYDEASGKYAVEVKGNGGQLIPYPYFDTDKTINGVKFTVEENGWIAFSGTPTENSGFMILKSEINANSGEVVTFSIERIGQTDGASILGWTANWGSFFKTKALSLTTNATQTGEISSNNVMIQLSLKANIAVNGKVRLMASIGNTALPYEPYKETTTTVYLDEPLRKGDKVYWNGGKLRIDRYRKRSKIKELYLSGVAEYADTNSNRFAFVIDANNGVDNDVMCDIATGVTGGSVVNTCRIYGEQLFLFLDKDAFASRENLTEYLAKNDVFAEYTLATPITEEIDIDLGELTMFYPTTVISNDCNANMEVTYIADTKAYIDKKFAELATAMV